MICDDYDTPNKPSGDFLHDLFNVIVEYFGFDLSMETFMVVFFSIGVAVSMCLCSCVCMCYSMCTMSRKVRKSDDKERAATNVLAKRDDDYAAVSISDSFFSAEEQQSSLRHERTYLSVSARLLRFKCVRANSRADLFKRVYAFFYYFSACAQTRERTYSSVCLCAFTI